MKTLFLYTPFKGMRRKRSFPSFIIRKSFRPQSCKYLHVGIAVFLSVISSAADAGNSEFWITHSVLCERLAVCWSSSLKARELLKRALRGFSGFEGIFWRCWEILCSKAAECKVSAFWEMALPYGNKVVFHFQCAEMLSRLRRRDSVTRSD